VISDRVLKNVAFIVTLSLIGLCCYFVLSTILSNSISIEEKDSKYLKELFEKIRKNKGKLEIDFLGLHLGCSYDEVQHVINNSANQMTFLGKLPAKNSMLYIYNGNYQINSVENTAFLFYKDKLTTITLVFLRDAYTAYDAVKEIIENKFGPMTDDNIERAMKFGNDFGKKNCQLVKDGMEILLRYEKKSDKIEETSLSAVHIKLLNAMRDDDIKDKVKELGDIK